MSIDSSIHSLFGVSKASADLLVQEYGKNFLMNTGIFRLGCITGPSHAGAELHGFLSYLIKANLKKYLILFMGIEESKLEIIFIAMIWLAVFGNFTKNQKKELCIILEEVEKIAVL